jgi:hypothetical protein
MYRDKLLTTFRNLNHKFDGLAELLDDRNLLLKVLMRKEMREDFLLSERIQSLDEIGGLSVSAMTRNVDLSPVNEMMPPLSIKQERDDADDEVKFAKGGAVGMNPIIDITAESLGSEPTDEPYQTLEESNAIVPIDKAAAAIVQDFEIDKKFKKAFQEAMTLPSKAAASSLMDTMSKTPSEGSGTTIIKKNLSVLQSAFKLPTPEPTEDEGEKETLNVDELKKKRDNWKKTEEKEEKKDKSKGLFELGLKFLIGKAASSRANAQAGGAMTESVATGDPLVPDFYSAPGYMPGYIGDGEKSKGGFWDRLKGGAKKAFDYTPMGMGMKMFGAAKDKFKNVTANPKVKGFLGGVGNFAKKAFKYTPMGMAASAAGGLINRFRGGDQTTNLNELTENVIQENQLKQEEQKQAAMNPIPIKMKNPAPASVGGNSGSMDQGSDEAIPKVKYSPYFDEYTITSQF